MEREAVLSNCILIVDDSEKIRANLRKFLEEELGISVCVEAVDGIDAVEKATLLEPDLVILDLTMPRMNGLQAAREIRSKPTRMPIILFTMHSEALQPRDVQRAGVDAVVPKADLGELKQNINKFLARR
jgi:DNA-binding NarL/FixJ family response regulator